MKIIENLIGIFFLAGTFLYLFQQNRKTLEILESFIKVQLRDHNESREKIQARLVNIEKELTQVKYFIITIKKASEHLQENNKEEKK